MQEAQGILNNLSVEEYELAGVLMQFHESLEVVSCELFTAHSAA